MTESIRPPEKAPAPQPSRLRRLLRLGHSKAQLLDAIQAWRGRMESAERERNAAQARAKDLRRELHRVRVESQQQAKALRQQVVAAREDGDARVARVRERLDALLNQPEESGKCTKVRFHREPEANDWLLTIAAAGDTVPEWYRTYQCNTCPRSPVTIQRVWHVGHDATVEAQAAAKAGKQRRSEEIKKSFRDGTALQQRIDPRVLAQLSGLRDSLRNARNTDIPPRAAETKEI